MKCLLGKAWVTKIFIVLVLAFGVPSVVLCHEGVAGKLMTLLTMVVASFFLGILLAVQLGLKREDITSRREA